MMDQIKTACSEAWRGLRGLYPRLPRPRRVQTCGYTLIEMAVAIIVTGVLLTIGVPRFAQSLEQSRADVAGANLRTIWSAQRLYWLENRTYAPDLNTLLSANLIDPSLPTATAPYAYAVVTPSDNSWFTATATRGGSPTWSGTFTIAADGTFSGSVQQSGQGVTLVPGFQ
jgi:prepilin-type N-terminal cleavage/methylation domain-containing protein